MSSPESEKNCNLSKRRGSDGWSADRAGMHRRGWDGVKQRKIQSAGFGLSSAGRLSEAERFSRSMEHRAREILRTAQAIKEAAGID